MSTQLQKWVHSSCTITCINPLTSQNCVTCENRLGIDGLDTQQPAFILDHPIHRRTDFSSVNCAYTLGHNYLERMFFVDFSILNRLSWNVEQAISKSCPNIGKNFVKVYAVFQKLDHLTCSKLKICCPSINPLHKFWNFITCQMV